MAIILPSGFRITNIDPVDSRFTASNATGRKSLSVVNVYEGLTVYQTDTDEYYLLKNAASPSLDSSWIKIILSSGSQQTITGSLEITQGITGSLFGTASWASNSSTASFVSNTVTSSFSLTSSYVNPLVQDVIITGSLLISGSIFQYSDNIDVDTPSETILSVPTQSYRSAFFDFVITSGSNARAGTVFSVWNGSNVEYTETSTNDIGSTTDVRLIVALSSSNVQLNAAVNSNNWSVKSLVRML